MKNQKVLLTIIIPLMFITCSLSKTVNEIPQVKKDFSNTKNLNTIENFELSPKELYKDSQEKRQSPDSSQSLSRSVTNQEVEISNSSGLSCAFAYENQFNPSYVRIGVKCGLSDDTSCVGFSSTLKSYCEEDQKILVQYFCDPKKEDLISAKRIKCEKSCVSGACTR